MWILGLNPNDNAGWHTSGAVGGKERSSQKTQQERLPPFGESASAMRAVHEQSLMSHWFQACVELATARPMTWNKKIVV
jgi:hypothetical protein